MRIAIPFLLALGTVVALVALGLFKKQPPKQEVRIPPALVEVVSAVKQDVRFQVDSQGTVEPRTETTLVSEVAGKIVSVSPALVAGGFFREGDILVDIDPSDYQVELKRAEAEYTRQKLALSQEQARSEQARRDWEALGRGEASELTLRVPQLREAEANVVSAEATLEKAQRNFERTRIRAPYDGMVREKRADLGQYVSPGTPVASLFATDYAEVRLPLTSRDLAYLELPALGAGQDWIGPGVVLKGRIGGRDHEWLARLVRTEGAFDPKSRVLYAVARVEDPYAREAGAADRIPLPMGMFVAATIDGTEAPGVFVLPRRVLRPDGTLLVVDADDKIDVRDVELLRAEGNLVYLSSGVEEGERVALTALEFVTEGMPVSIVGEDGEASASVASSEPPRN